MFVICIGCDLDLRRIVRHVSYLMRVDQQTYTAYNPAMRIGIAQINPHVGAIDQNLKLILSYIEKARCAGSDLVIFPELSLPGSSPQDLLWRRDFVEQVQRALEDIASSSAGIGVIVGAISSCAAERPAERNAPCLLGDREKPSLGNSAFFFSDGALIGKESQLIVPSYDICSDGRYFTSGPGAQVFDFRGIRFGINVCVDPWADDGPMDVQASLGAQVVINISASPFVSGLQIDRRELATKRAKENGVRLICVNLVGGQDELVYDGGSFVIGHEGDLLFEAPYFSEGLFVLDLEKLIPVRERTQHSIDLIHRALVLGIHDYVQKNGFKQVIIGTSGGIDSAVVAALAAEALGEVAITGVFLPSRITSETSKQDAKALARTLGIELVEIGITEAVSAFHRVFPQPVTGLSAENLQARTRGTVLMTLANQQNALILATGNKSEIAVGYNTLYGDTVGALAPIADLYKTQVYDLAKGMRERIPKRIVNKPPSAELRPGQRDQDDLPPYPLLDAILYELIENNSSRKDLIAQGFPEAVVTDILCRYYQSEYKRNQLPPAIKVSKKAFGMGRRMPITHAYRN